ncbi:MAG: FtsX-like permease family protein [Firmicutes bacterium ADurb.Bin099]|jgi:ABC-type antimicrobial peptide transport system permease subunit|nr:MAG: FtsX-like permease family protein [Firmicutes bacterium ADurb.Bin099]HPY98779.1 hypothetical protein [Clostridia bacterium]HQC68665.1 hypothetical protein [Clostridia bacterium]
MKNLLRRITHSLSYTFTILIRKAVKSIAVVLSIAAFTVLLCLLEFTLHKQERLLDELYKKFDIDIIIMDSAGAYPDNLELDRLYASVFMNENNILGKNTDNLKIRSSGKETISVTNEYGEVITEISVVGLTYLPDMAEFNVSVYVGNKFDKSVLMSGSRVCIVPGRMKGLGDCIYIKTEKVEEPIEYLVIGTYDEAEDIFFCPYLNYSELLTSSVNNIYSLKCEITDTKVLEELETFLMNYFTKPTIAGITPRSLNALDLKYTHSFVMPKGNFEEATDPIKADILKLKILEPFVFVFSVAIGFVISMLSIRNRKAEFAVMRSMGASGGYVFYISFIEQAVLCLIGALIGVLVSLIGFKQLSATQINKVLIFIGCYLAGTAIEALRIASVKVMKIMKAND